MMKNTKQELTTETKSKKLGKGTKITVITVAAILIVLIILSICVGAYNKMPDNTYISGVNVSGMTVEQVENTLNDKLNSAFENKNIKLICDGKTYEIAVSNLEPSADIRRTAEETLKNRLGTNIFSKLSNIISAKFNKSEDALSVELNNEKLEGIVNDFAVNFEKPAKESCFELQGDYVKIYKGEEGIEFNRDKVKQDIYDSVASLKFNDVTMSLEKTEPREISVDEFYEQITSPAVNAYYEKVNGKLSVNPGSPQISIDKDKLRAAMESSEKVSEIAVTTKQPSITKAYLESKIFVDKLASHTSKFNTSNVGRSTNVRLSASKINNFVLLPGEVFSYDKTVGPRTAANGFKEAGVYIGNKVEQGIGGGICQTSSTLYSAVLYANLEIVTRTSHSLPVSYMPDGQDATIAQGAIDFQFKNNTDYPVKIVTYTNGGSLTCELYGVKEPGISVQVVHSRTATLPSKVTRTTDNSIPVGYKKITQKGADGYKVASTRIVYQNGTEIKRENLTSSVYNSTPTTEVVNPNDKNTPSENLQIYSGNIAPTDEPDQNSAQTAQEVAENTVSENEVQETEAVSSETTEAENSASTASTEPDIQATVLEPTTEENAE